MLRRFKVKLELFRKSVSALLTFGYSVASHMLANANFTTPAVPLADLTTALDELNVAIQDANGGGLEEHSIMNDKRRTVIDLLTAEGHYVEDTANDPSNNDHEVTVIESAGMLVRGFSPAQKRVFSAKAGKLPGEVNLVAGSVTRGFHEWAYTTTPEDPESWVDLTSTTKASTMASGLTPLTVYTFRHRAILISGPEPWDDNYTVIVL